MTGVEVKYGDLALKPAPNISYQREVYKTNDNSKIIGGLHRFTLEGTLLPTGNDVSKAVQSFKDLQTLQGAFSEDYKPFYIDFLGTSADCTGTVIAGRPVVENLSASSPDNWTQRVDYTIELVFAGSAITGVQDYLGSGMNIQSTTTSYSVEYLSKGFTFLDETAAPVIQISRSVAAQGLSMGSGNVPTGIINVNDGDGTPSGIVAAGQKGTNIVGIQRSAFDNALLYVSGLIGESGNSLSFPRIADSILNIDTDDCAIHLTDRSVNISPEDGSLDLSDTFLAIPVQGTKYTDIGAVATNRPTGYCVLDNFSLDVSTEIENGLGTISLQGTIQGYPSYGNSGLLYAIEDPNGNRKTAFYNASGYLSEMLASGFFYNRASGAYAHTGTLSNPIPLAHVLPLNDKPISESFSYNIEEGSIGYNFTYNNRPMPIVTGALTEKVNISKNRQVPVHAALTILGRAAGPILQDIGTKSAFTQDISIEAQFVPWTGYSSGWVKDNGFLYGFIDAGLQRPNRMEGLGQQGDPSERYNALIASFEIYLSGEGYTYFKTADSDTYDIKTGRYGRSASYIYTPCG